ncbi:hypothetical protein TH53_17505 [Pedobacter lusitanus]|uniref:Contig76, whole genome shotgun sequence n=1 Tax=Pedobacter lusitanus TaxID=1503925 RepID=A0A0D0FU79_9SPHI|nr:hypothetical protein [Pedobacter lusitanus]KIO76014.1 hypothetical protein TH53_17505 [Pedobacter lusitanus]
MEKFPQLKDRQVALLRADINTGIVLDRNYIYATTSDQEVYTVFDDINSAIRSAKAIIAEKKRHRMWDLWKRSSRTFNIN